MSQSQTLCIAAIVLGGCTAGPLEISPAPEPPIVPRSACIPTGDRPQLVTETARPLIGALAVMGDDLYFTSVAAGAAGEGQLARVPRCGGGIELIGAPSVAPQLLVRDGRTLRFVSRPSGEVGAALWTFTPGDESPRALQLDRDTEISRVSVVEGWTYALVSRVHAALSESRLLRVAARGDAAVQLAEGLLTVSGDELVGGRYPDDGQWELVRVDAAGGEDRLWDAPIDFAGWYATGGFLYALVDQDTFGAKPTLQRRALRPDASPEVLCDLDGRDRTILPAVDGDDLFFVDDSGLRHVRLGRAGATLLTTVAEGGGAMPLALDSDRVYYATVGDGGKAQIWAIDRPRP